MCCSWWRSILGGVVVPVRDLPGPLSSVALASPVGALAEAFRAALGDGATIVSPLIICRLGRGGGVHAARLFRWD